MRACEPQLCEPQLCAPVPVTTRRLADISRPRRSGRRPRQGGGSETVRSAVGGKVRCAVRFASAAAALAYPHAAMYVMDCAIGPWKEAAAPSPGLTRKLRSRHDPG